MDNLTLSPYQDRYATYDIEIPSDIENDIIITARLLFRTFKPNFILNHHPEFLSNLPIFEVSSISTIVEVQND